MFSPSKSGSLFGITKEETHELHLRNRILSGDYFLSLSPLDSALNHRCQEVKTLYDISLHSPCAASYQRLVGTNCFDVPDPWPNLQQLWDYDTPCNKLPDVIFKYWDSSYLKSRCGKPVIIGIRVGRDDKIHKVMLTTHYGRYLRNESWCKTIDKWLAGEPSFVIYHVSTPELLPNGHLFESVEMFHSHSSDLKVSSQTLKPQSETHSNEAWNLSTHSKDDVDEFVVSGSNKSNVSLESYTKACSKPHEFIRG